MKNHLQPFFSGSLRGIELGQIEKYIAMRLESDPKPAPATVNREIFVLRHVVKRALAWTDDAGAKYLTRSPLENWKPLAESSGKNAFFLHAEEIPRLLEACLKSRCHYLEPFVRLALNTGMRRGEILALTRKDIDWNGRTLTIAHSKNGEVGYVPLNTEAMAALRAAIHLRISRRSFFTISSSAPEIA